MKKVQPHNILLVLFAFTIVIVTGIVILSTNSTNAKTLTDTQRLSLAQEITTALFSNQQKSGTTVSFSITADTSNTEIVDGYVTDVWSYNGSVPGPEIRLSLGDTLRLHFTNNLPQESTIHFHGVRVPNNMDGVPGITQNAVKQGETFVYEFTPKDAGTFWFHPHSRSSEQVERGLYGTLVVEDDLVEHYSQDVVFVLDDWLLDEANGKLIEQFNHPHDVIHGGRWGNVVTTNGSTNEVLMAQPGERIRLRFVNASNARIFQFSTDALKPVGIAVDGLSTGSEINPDNFYLAPGNRIDLDAKIPEDASGSSFLIRDIYTETPHTLLEIRVDGDMAQTPSFEPPINKMIPDWSSLLNIKPDKEYILDGGMGNTTSEDVSNNSVWKINGKSYPLYDQLKLPANAVSIIRFTNKSLFPHPMHLHGQFFKIISRNGALTNESFFRDTVLVQRDETIDIAVPAMDVGTWALHCHTLEHAESGMMTLFKVN